MPNTMRRLRLGWEFNCFNVVTSRAVPLEFYPDQGRFFESDVWKDMIIMLVIRKITFQEMKLIIVLMFADHPMMVG